ncbi:UNVERIFIED_CONTAM: hypothetical protein FKN15_073831 [Acipenser sinensis]
MRCGSSAGTTLVSERDGHSVTHLPTLFWDNEAEAKRLVEKQQRGGTRTPENPWQRTLAAAAPLEESVACRRPAPLPCHAKQDQWQEAWGIRWGYPGLPPAYKKTWRWRRSTVSPTTLRQQIRLAIPTSLEQALAHTTRVEAVLEEGRNQLSDPVSGEERGESLHGSHRAASLEKEGSLDAEGQPQTLLEADDGTSAKEPTRAATASAPSPAMLSPPHATTTSGAQDCS